MNLTGTITTAGWKPNRDKTKNVFSFGFNDGGKDKTIYLKTDEVELQNIAMSMIGKVVTMEGEESTSGDRTYFNPSSIKPAPESAQPVKTTPAKETDWDLIGRQKARCDLFQSACHLLAGVYGTANAVAITNLGEQAVIIAQIGEAYVFSESKQPEPKPASSELGKLFWKACKAAGYDPDTKKGVEDIKAWIKKAGKTELPFGELTAEKQGELIKMMQVEKLAE